MILAGDARDRGSRRGLHGLVLIPGAALPLLPSATCPACIAAYAGGLSAVGSAHLVLYAGVALLVAASLWNLWLKWPRPEPLIQLRVRRGKGVLS